MDAGLTLTPQMAIVLALIVFTVVMFALDWIRADIIALLVLVTLGVANLVPADQIFDGFAGNAVMAILATMILGAGLDRTGVLSKAASFILRLSQGMERRLLLVLCALTGAMSAFMQNPALTALFLPVVSRISSRTGLPLSRLLLPMACCIILGGTLTMVGNSPQILLNDLISSVNRSACSRSRRSASCCWPSAWSTSRCTGTRSNPSARSARASRPRAPSPTSPPPTASRARSSNCWSPPTARWSGSRSANWRRRPRPR